MKFFTKVVAVLMITAVFAALMTACGESKPETETATENHINSNLVGTWKQTSDDDGNWTWTFNDDGTCKLEGDNFSSDGTYLIESEDSGKIKISLDQWNEKDQQFTFSVTDKKLILQSFDNIYTCDKQ